MKIDNEVLERSLEISKRRFNAHDTISIVTFLSRISEKEKYFDNLSLAQSSRIENTSFDRLSLVNAELFQISYSSVLFTNVNLSSSNLCWNRFSNCQIINSNLQGVYLRGSVLENTLLSECNLSDANLIDVNMQSAQLENVNLHNAFYSNKSIFPRGFSPDNEGMIFVDSEKEVFDAFSSIPFIHKIDINNDLLNKEDCYDEEKSIEIALTDTYKLLKNTEKNSIKELSIDRFLGEVEMSGIHTFASYKAVGKHLDFYLWLCGVLRYSFSGKIPGCWTVFRSKEYLKSTFKVEDDLKEQILKAEELIQKSPILPVGDTIKPLSGNKFKGLWRYRIGDFRIVYYPCKQTRNILIATLSNRGEVYSRMRSLKEYKKSLENHNLK
jgi:mRNA-degrading endonuclease RelE of RelBE toxin-antitoxin system